MMSDPCSSLVNDDLLRDEDAKIQNASLCWMVKIVIVYPSIAINLCILTVVYLMI